MKRRQFIKNTSLLGVGLTGIASASVSARVKLFGSQKLSDTIPKVDTHMHLWDIDNLSYPWLQKSELLNQTYDTQAYQKASLVAHIAKMIFVECGVAKGQNIEEVKWVIEQMKKDPRIQGIVAKSDLTQDTPIEAEWEQFQSLKWVKGVRSGANSELLHQASYLKRLNKLSEYDLSFDLHVGPVAYQAAENAIRQAENTQFILNHIGIPDIQNGEWESWQKGIIQLAKLPNLSCKISGVITRIGTDWQLDQIRPYIDHIIETFGMNRIMYGGDWPVVLKAGSYQDWASAFEHLTKDLTSNELHQLYHLNAERVYRI